MTLQHTAYSEAEKLAVIEQLIIAEKKSISRQSGHGGQTEKLYVLRAVAADIRGRLPGERNDTLMALSNIVLRLKASARSSTRVHPEYDRELLRMLGREVIARWVQIRGALLDQAKEGQ